MTLRPYDGGSALPAAGCHPRVGPHGLGARLPEHPVKRLEGADDLASICSTDWQYEFGGTGIGLRPQGDPRVHRPHARTARRESRRRRRDDPRLGEWTPPADGDVGRELRCVTDPAPPSGRRTRLAGHPDAGLEVDLFIGQTLATPHRQADPTGHLLGTWVLTRPFTEMVAWSVGGNAPRALERAARRTLRRGPVPGGPALSTDERRHVTAHMQAVANRADRRTARGLLLARQAYYQVGFDTSPDTKAWLAQMYLTDRRALLPAKGWSPSWPLARSTASALTRLGDPEPMRQFIADQLCDDAGERANLNYWAFWTGDYDEQQTSDAFIGSTPLSAWRGDRLMRHLLDRLHGNIGFLELNIHTLWSLIRVRPEMISDRAVADELQAKLERLLDENLVSTAARRELDALRYGIAMTRRC